MGVSDFALLLVVAPGWPEASTNKKACDRKDRGQEQGFSFSTWSCGRRKQGFRHSAWPCTTSIELLRLRILPSVHRVGQEGNGKPWPAILRLGSPAALRGISTRFGSGAGPVGATPEGH